MKTEKLHRGRQVGLGPQSVKKQTISNETELTLSADKAKVLGSNIKQANVMPFAGKVVKDCYPLCKEVVFNLAHYCRLQEENAFRYKHEIICKRPSSSFSKTLLPDVCSVPVQSPGWGAGPLICQNWTSALSIHRPPPTAPPYKPADRTSPGSQSQCYH
ncbi:hypothetical protein J4Q44_G00356180 [Coregonus suidteri]|uniref:Uncharacterized protein n=1 Tax=Coregonus suidteri TaxID=861788 RepID=A0AAN8KN98_9TELE